MQPTSLRSPKSFQGMEGLTYITDQERKMEQSRQHSESEQTKPTTIRTLINLKQFHHYSTNYILLLVPRECQVVEHSHTQ